MPEVFDTTSAAASPSPTRRRLTRTAAALASGGLLVGAGAAAGPAFAATDGDCTPDITVAANVAGDNQSDIQTLLDAEAPLVCLEGTFVIDGPLNFGHNVTLFGRTAAALDAQSNFQILGGDSGASLTVQNLSFLNANAQGGLNGGAIYVDGGLIVENSRFENNVASGSGGAIFTQAPATITDSVFIGNRSAANLPGGAIFAGDVVIEDSTFIGNGRPADDQGGLTSAGGAVNGSDVTVTGSTFTDNVARDGGAVYGFDLSIVESTFVDNISAFGGDGGAAYGFFNTTVRSSTFAGNSTQGAGGAIYAAVFVDISNSTLVGNTSEVTGGAVYNIEGGGLSFNTFLNNVAETGDSDDFSDAVYAFDAPISLLGNIFAGSRSTPQLGAAFGSYDDLGGNVFSTSEATESDVAPASASTLFDRSVAEIFGPSPVLADNGGPTETVALIAGSPAIDILPADSIVPVPVPSTSPVATAEVLPAATVEDLSVDQRGVTRDALSDAGAFEYVGEPELAATGSDAAATGWLAGIAALLLGSGVAVALAARLRSRSSR